MCDSNLTQCSNGRDNADHQMRVPLPTPLKTDPQGDCMNSRGRGPHGAGAAVRAWAVWALPRWLTVFVTGVVLLDAAGLGFAASRGAGDRHDMVLFALLLACDVGSLELTRRAGERAGVSRDMHALWELPVALLLPLVYAPLIPIIRLAFTQWRGPQRPPHRPVLCARRVGVR